MEILLRTTLSLALMMMLVLSATCGSAVEPPRVLLRNSRSHGPIKMNISPTFLTMNYGDYLKVKCRARGGHKVEDMPFISFYRRLDEHTVLPMSSGFPGVTIETVASSRRHAKPSRHKRSVKYLKLGPEVWETLYQGENTFYCKGYSMNGDSESAYFVVNKV